MSTTMDDEQEAIMWPVRFAKALCLTPRLLYARLGQAPIVCAFIALFSFMIVRATGGWWLALFAFYGSATIVMLVVWSWLIMSFALSFFARDADDFADDFDAVEEPARTRTLRTTVNF